MTLSYMQAGIFWETDAYRRNGGPIDSPPLNSSVSYYCNVRVVSGGLLIRPPKWQESIFSGGCVAVMFAEIADGLSYKSADKA